ncbi:MAG: FliM/FliN family flagellar motor switch protein [Armatimonadetes bacterium]|nr:FliM/FliN family flagellar motor switch protein [Armatimonadota bacterium]
MTSDGLPAATEIITQDELDSLLASLAVADRRRRPASEAATAALVDFRHAACMSPDHMRLLQSRLAVLAGTLNRTLSLYLDTPARFRVHSLDVTSTEQYLRNLASRPVLAVVTFEGGTSPALWEISAPLAVAALHCMLGGASRPAGTGNERPFGEGTPLERAVLRRFFQEVLCTWSELWDRLKALRPQVESVVASPAGIDLRAADERLLSAMLEGSFAGTQGMLRVGLPLGLVKRLLRDERETVTAEEIVAGASAPNAASHLPACEPVARTPVTVAARLRPPAIPIAELLNLHPGAVLNLRLPAGSPFTIEVGDAPKFQAVAGSANGRLAVRIVAPAPEAETGPVCSPRALPG